MSSSKKSTGTYKISQTVSARQQDVSELLNEVLQILEQEMGVLRGTLTLRKAGSDILNIEASCGLSDREMQRGCGELSEGITGRVAQTGEMELVADVSQSPDFLNRTKARDDEEIAFICVPIIHHKGSLVRLALTYP